MGTVLEFRPRGFFAGLSAEQKRQALAYRGEESHGDRWAERHNPHSPMHTAPLMQPGRDAGSIADVSPATRRLRDSILDLVGFAKTGGPSLPDSAG